MKEFNELKELNKGNTEMVHMHILYWYIMKCLKSFFVNNIPSLTTRCTNEQILWRANVCAPNIVLPM